MPERGDPWATIDDEPQSIEPLVARYEGELPARIGIRISPESDR